MRKAILENIIETHDPRTNRTRRYDLHSPIDAVKYMARNPYVWPGGHNIVLVMNDGGFLCQECLLGNYREILFDTLHKWSTGWDAAGITYELDSEEFCSHCGNPVGV